MVKSLSYLLLSAVIAVSLSGCNYKQVAENSDTDYGTRQANDPKMLGGRAYGSMSNKASQHNNSYFEYSSAISRKVKSLNGISDAIVMLTDKNAYVGLMLDWTAVGTRNSGGTREQDNTSSTEGGYHTDNIDKRMLISPYNSYFSVKDHHNLSDELKQTVALLVRKEAPNAQEVHISANMEYVNYMSEFAKEAWGGRSLTPWIDTFNIVVQYHFANGTIKPKPITRAGPDDSISGPLVKPDIQQ